LKRDDDGAHPTCHVRGSQRSARSPPASGPAAQVQDAGTGRDPPDGCARQPGDTDAADGRRRPRCERRVGAPPPRGDRARVRARMESAPRTRSPRARDHTARSPRAPPTSGARRRSVLRALRIAPRAVDRLVERVADRGKDLVQLVERQLVEPVLKLAHRGLGIRDEPSMQYRQGKCEAIRWHMPRATGEEGEAGRVLDAFDGTETKPELALALTNPDWEGLDHDAVPSWTSPVICSTS